MKDWAAAADFLPGPGQWKLEKREHRYRFRCLDQWLRGSEPKLRWWRY
jgi:hypothetical protein